MIGKGAHFMGENDTRLEPDGVGQNVAVATAAVTSSV